ncbi:hypothetical protein DIS24_g12566 [Lasiodiplodia hormozganensis]|uniref:Uncharacterized protein n=1 Tax=Lasiodiplodia hormozganensis TaxID=869390 RepID=A0AA39TJ49_9PEZI|nr:hypothetical protein DIS24_g12566 [Lasiodiplodia hormozganensis]
MHIATISLLYFLALAPPSQASPPRLVRSTGCRCATTNASSASSLAAAAVAGADDNNSNNQQQQRVFWLQPPPMEAPGDTCSRLASQLEHWLDWIDGRSDLQAAWQLYDDVRQNRLQQERLVRTETAAEASSSSRSGGASGGAQQQQQHHGETVAKVTCDVEGMNDEGDGVALCDMLVVKVVLGAIMLVVLFESITTISRRLGRGLSEFFSGRRSTGAIRI